MTALVKDEFIADLCRLVPPRPFPTKPTPTSYRMPQLPTRTLLYGSYNKAYAPLINISARAGLEEIAEDAPLGCPAVRSPLSRLCVSPTAPGRSFYPIRAAYRPSHGEGFVQVVVFTLLAWELSLVGRQRRERAFPRRLERGEKNANLSSVVAVRYRNSSSAFSVPSSV